MSYDIPDAPWIKNAERYGDPWHRPSYYDEDYDEDYNEEYEEDE